MDILKGSLWKNIPMYALPIAATGILSQLFNAADIAVVGNFTGDISTAAVAAVGANSSIIAFIVNLFIGVSLGANVVIATSIGQKNDKAVHDAVHSSVLFSVLCGILVTILGEFVAPSILGALNVPDDVFPYALEYLRIYLLGLPVIFLYNFESSFFRSIGDTKTPLYVLLFSGVLNVVLNLIFVIGFKMNVNGVAWATVISNAVSSVILFILLLKTDTVIKIIPKNLRFHGAVFLRILKIGVPAGVQSAVFAAANIIIQSAINSLGTIIMAASSTAYNIEIFAYYVLNSFSQACTTFVGQNYGAGQLERCKKTMLVCLVEDTFASAAAIGLVLSSGKFLISIFDSDPAVIEAGYQRLVIIFIAYIFSMIYEILSGYLRGYGISFVPALLTAIGVCGVRIFWIYAIFPNHRSFTTIMAAFPISLCLTAIFMACALIYYKPAHRYFKAKKQA